MSANEHVLDKIRRLLRLAESANEHEAASASARAQELMSRHRIELAAVDVDAEEEITLNEDPVDEFGRMVWWRHNLARAVAQANGCRVVVRREAGSRTTLLVIGTREDEKLVRGLYLELVRAVDGLAQYHGEGRGRTWAGSFRLGAVSAIVARLGQAAEQARREVEAGGGKEAGVALVRLDAREDALVAFLGGLGVKQQAHRSRRNYDYGAYARGRAEGERVSLEGRASGHGLERGVDRPALGPVRRIGGAA